MINFFDPLTIAGVMTLAAAGGGSSLSDLCEPPHPTQINIIPYSAEVHYDVSKTMAELQSQQIDTINPYGFEATSHVNGYSSGHISMEPEIKIDHKVILNGAAICMWYEEVTIRINIQPKIVIAKELLKDKCRFEAVKEHELKHVDVDKQVVNRYAQSVGAKLYDGLKSRGFSVGPVKVESAQAIADRMYDTVIQLAQFEFRKLEIDRAESQQAVDSLEEYTRVSNLCKDRSYGASRSR